jgi:deoxyribonucleoside regulator
LERRSRTALSRDGLFRLADVARLYYLENLSQEQIARRIGVSRSNVSRMLKDARAQGMVEIRIHSPLETVPRLQEELKARLGLRECLVMAAVHRESRALEAADTVGEIAAFTARYLQENIPDGSIVGVGWSRTVYRSVNGGYLRKKSDVTVAQLMGSVGSSIPELNGISITARLADTLRANAHYLHAPMLVTDAAVRKGLLRDPYIRRTLEVARRADIMVVGVGAINRDHGQYRTGYLNDADLDYIRGSGAVGDVCGSYFSSDGSPVPLEMNERTIATSLEDMKRIPNRVCVSWGAQKALANVGAVRSGLLNVLITDEDTAREMLDILENKNAGSSSKNVTA